MRVGMHYLILMSRMQLSRSGLMTCSAPRTQQRWAVWRATCSATMTLISVQFEWTTKLSTWDCVLLWRRFTSWVLMSMQLLAFLECDFRLGKSHHLRSTKSVSSELVTERFTCDLWPRHGHTPLHAKRLIQVQFPLDITFCTRIQDCYNSDYMTLLLLLLLLLIRSTTTWRSEDTCGDVDVYLQVPTDLLL
jgi:hypothetical protein